MDRVIVTALLFGLMFSGIPLLEAAGEPSWLEVRSPHFRVVSNGTEKQSRRTAAQFEQFRSVIHNTLPRLRVDPAIPLTVLAVRDENGLKALLPQYWAGKGGIRPPGIFLAGPEKSNVALRLDIAGEHAYHVIYHEYVHMLLQLNFRRLPLWLSEGLAEFYGHATLSESESGLGRASQEQLGILKKAQLLPLSSLLTIDHQSPYYREQDKADLFYAQAWALVHYLMIGDKGAHFRQMTAYLESIQKGTSDSEAVAALGDLQQLEKALGQYVQQRDFYYYKVSATQAAEERQYSLRSLPPAEVLAVQGDFHVHNGRLVEARAALTEAARLDPRSAAVQESLGLLSLREGNTEAAVKHFSAAVDLDSGSYLAHFYAAQAALTARGDTGLGQAETHLRRAIEINPTFAPAYANLATALVSSGGNLTEALELATRAVEMEPGVVAFQLHVGRILLNMQREDEAIRLGERLLAAPQSTEERGEIESFLAAARQQQQFLADQKKREEERLARSREEERRGEPVPQAQNPAKVPAAGVASGTLAVMEGTVRSVTCSFPTVMDLVLDAGGKEYRFRAPDLFSLRYGAAGKQSRSDFQPCTELEGAQVRLEYKPLADEEILGEIQGVFILKQK